MATTIRASARFPVGTLVGAYPESNWTSAQLPPSGAPQGSPAETATVAADGTLTFASLPADTLLYVAAQVGGTWAYVRLRTDPTPEPRWEVLPDADYQALPDPDPNTLYFTL